MNYVHYDLKLLPFIQASRQNYQIKKTIKAYIYVSMLSKYIKIKQFFIKQFKIQ